MTQRRFENLVKANGLGVYFFGIPEAKRPTALAVSRTNHLAWTCRWNRSDCPIPTDTTD